MSRRGAETVLRVRLRAALQQTFDEIGIELVRGPMQRRGAVALRGGMSITPDRSLRWLSRADLVLVPGLDDHRSRAPEPLLEALRRILTRVAAP